MGRFQSYGRGDTPWTPDGDAGFDELDMLHDRGNLPPGTLARSENKRLQNGIAETRPGTAFPGDFNPAFEDIISGSGIFNNPNGEQVMLVATENADYVWALQYGKDPVQIDLDAGETTSTKRIFFVQAFDKVLLLRRPEGSDPILVWDGDNTNTFDPMTLESPGITQVPARWNGEPFSDRIIYYNDYFNAPPIRDQLIVSDALNETAYDDFLGVFRINAGESDYITRVMGYFKSAVLVFMKHSVHILQNFTTDFFAAEQDKVSAKVGSVGNLMPLMVGQRVSFLNEPSGFFWVDEIIQDKIATDPTPFSRKIQPVIDNIDWNRAKYWAHSESLGDYSFYALPMKGSDGGCDVVAVHNHATNKWEAIDKWTNEDFRLYAMHKTLYDGQERVFGLDYLNKRVYVMYTGNTDETNTFQIRFSHARQGAINHIPDVIETRGYTCGDPAGWKRFERAVIGLNTLDPTVTVTAITDGVNEEKQIDYITKDSAKSYIHGHDEFDPATDDPNEPYREDYSTGASNFAGEDFEGLPDGEIAVLPATAIEVFGTKQQSLSRPQIGVNARWVSIRIDNFGGKCDVLGVGVEGHPVQNTFQTIA